MVGQGIATAAARSGADQRTTELLRCGSAAGPLYLLAAFAQILTRDGFDMRRHAVSQLSNGEWGWIQIANFLVVGCLVIAGAVGLRRALGPGRGRTWGPILLGVYGLGMLGAGIFVADPGGGFPPGAPEVPATMSISGILHFVFAGLGFYALIAACLVFAVRFRQLGDTSWTVGSALTGIVFFIAFAAVAWGSTSPVAVLGLYAAVVLAWIWFTALMFRSTPR